jgi:hypothetical protein
MACGAAGHGAIRLHELAMPSSIEWMTGVHPEVVGVDDEYPGASEDCPSISVNGLDL